MPVAGSQDCSTYMGKKSRGGYNPDNNVVGSGKIFNLNPDGKSRSRSKDG